MHISILVYIATAAGLAGPWQRFSCLPNWWCW